MQAPSELLRMGAGMCVGISIFMPKPCCSLLIIFFQQVGAFGQLLEIPSLYAVCVLVHHRRCVPVINK